MSYLTVSYMSMCSVLQLNRKHFPLEQHSINVCCWPFQSGWCCILNSSFTQRQLCFPGISSLPTGNLSLPLSVNVQLWVTWAQYLILTKSLQVHFAKFLVIQLTAQPHELLTLAKEKQQARGGGDRKCGPEMGLPFPVKETLEMLVKLQLYWAAYKVQNPFK